MRKIIKGKVYDTDTAIELFKKGTTDCRTTNFNDWFEEYYVTRKGNFFMKYWGGALTKYSEAGPDGQGSVDGSGIKPLTEEEVLDSFDNSVFDINDEAIEKYLNIEEA